ncbi:hypothetical protein HZS_5784 [Henneguya salminicola]|nr:hypothetical protein HZS_5784 [Henneguya salminicola]
MDEVFVYFDNYFLILRFLCRVEVASKILASVRLFVIFSPIYTYESHKFNIIFLWICFVSYLVEHRMPLHKKKCTDLTKIIILTY